MQKTFHRSNFLTVRITSQARKMRQKGRRIARLVHIECSDTKWINISPLVPILRPALVFSDTNREILEAVGLSWLVRGPALLDTQKDNVNGWAIQLLNRISILFEVSGNQHTHEQVSNQNGRWKFSLILEDWKSATINRVFQTCAILSVRTVSFRCKEQVLRFRNSPPFHLKIYDRSRVFCNVDTKTRRNHHNSCQTVH